jgi:hypothetical protein
MVSLEFFIDINRSGVPRPLCRIPHSHKCVPGIFPGGGGLRRPMRGDDNLTTFMYRLPINLGASTSWNPKGLSRPVMGLLLHLTSLLNNTVFYDMQLFSVVEIYGPSGGRRTSLPTLKMVTCSSERLMNLYHSMQLTYQTTALSTAKWLVWPAFIKCCQCQWKEQASPPFRT